MKQIKKLLNEIIKKSKDKDAVFTYGYEFSSDSGYNYRAMIRFSKSAVEPLLAGADTLKGLEKALKGYLNGDSIKNIAIMYCEAQIEVEKKAIKFHLDLIDDYKKAEDEGINP